MPALSVLSHLHGAARYKCVHDHVEVVVSVGAGGPGQHAYGGRCRKLLSPSQEKFLLCEKLSISRSLDEEVGAAGCVHAISAPPMMEFNFCVKAISHIYTTCAQKWVLASSEEIHMYREIRPGNNAAIATV